MTDLALDLQLDPSGSVQGTWTGEAPTEPEPPEPQPIPEPTKWLTRFEHLTRVWNKASPSGSGAQYPDYIGEPFDGEGGIFEVHDAVTGLDGFKMVLTPSMIYPNTGDSRLVRICWGDPFQPFGDEWLTGKRTVWEWVDMFPDGQEFEDDHTAPALFEYPTGPSVGHNMTRQGNGDYLFQRNSAPGKNWAKYSGPACEWGKYHWHKWDIYWTEDSDGFIRFETDGVEWVNYTGKTIMAPDEAPWTNYWHMRAALPPPDRVNTRLLLGLRVTEVSSKVAEGETVTEASRYLDNSADEKAEKSGHGKP